MKIWLYLPFRNIWIFNEFIQSASSPFTSNVLKIAFPNSASSSSPFPFSSISSKTCFKLSSSTSSYNLLKNSLNSSKSMVPLPSMSAIVIHFYAISAAASFVMSPSKSSLRLFINLFFFSRSFFFCVLFNTFFSFLITGASSPPFSSSALVSSVASVSVAPAASA